LCKRIAIAITKGYETTNTSVQIRASHRPCQINFTLVL
jgi:hypothetical protein